MSQTVILLTAGATWTVPADWTPLNTIDCIAPGASGSASLPDGGGAGAFARKNNVSTNLNPGDVVTIQIGAGNSGNATFLKNNVGTTIVSAAAPAANARSGGAAGSCIGDVKNSGGDGGLGSAGDGLNACGGGGAATKDGAGVNGNANNHGGLNGNGGASGSGAAGGLGNSGVAPGSPGAEYAISAGGTAGGGGGGGGNGHGSAGAGSDGGLYGGGGSGLGAGAGPTQGAGGAGCIVITYTPFVGQSWESQRFNVAFAKPFSAAKQQFSAFQPAGVIVSTFPDGYRGVHWEYRFAKPFPPQAQQFTSYEPIGATPTGIAPDGWKGQQLDVKFATKFPAACQLYSGFQPRGTVIITTPQGFQGQQFDYRFVRPVPVTEQPFTTAPEPQPFPPPNGWYTYEYSYQFAKPFPVVHQIYSVVQLRGDIPIFFPPGSGKRKDFPRYIPQPAYDAKPNPPFRPVWDKPREGEIERPESAPVPGPPPLPPLDVFGGPAIIDTSYLPSFGQYVPQDLTAFGQQMRTAMDLSDAAAVAKPIETAMNNDDDEAVLALLMQGGI